MKAVPVPASRITESAAAKPQLPKSATCISINCAIMVSPGPPSNAGVM